MHLSRLLDMKRALVVQMSAREKAELLYAEEQERRLALEQEAARLAAANRALEAERSAWTAGAVETLASSLENALVSDIARRVTAGIFASSDAPRDAQGSGSDSPPIAHGQKPCDASPSPPPLPSPSGLEQGQGCPVVAPDVEMSDANHGADAGANVGSSLGASDAVGRHGGPHTTSNTLP